MMDDEKLAAAFKERGLRRSSLRLLLHDNKTDKSKVLSFSQFSAFTSNEAIHEFGKQLESLIPFSCLEEDVVATFYVG